MFLTASWTCGSDIISYKQNNLWNQIKISNKVDNLVVGIFDSAPRIYLRINTRISFVLSDSALCLKGFLEVGATVYMRIAGGVGILHMCKLYWKYCCSYDGFTYLAHPVIILL